MEKVIKLQIATFTMHSNDRVFRVPLTADAKRVLSEKVEDLYSRFFTAMDILEYAPGYITGDDEAFRIEYDLKGDLSRITDFVPADIEPLTAKIMNDDPPRALAHVLMEDEPAYVFQSITKRDFLSAKSAFFFADRHFDVNRSDAIVPPDRVDAIQFGGVLYFRKDTIVSRFLDVRDAIVAPATDVIIREYFQDKSFFVPDMTSVIAHFNTMSRRKIARLHHEQKRCDVDVVIVAADQLGVPLEVVDGAIEVRADKSYIKALLDLLSDCYLKSPVTPDALFYSNSTRRIG